MWQARLYGRQLGVWRCFEHIAIVAYMRRSLDWNSSLYSAPVAADQSVVLRMVMSGTGRGGILVIVDRSSRFTSPLEA